MQFIKAGHKIKIKSEGFIVEGTCLEITDDPQIEHCLILSVAIAARHIPFKSTPCFLIVEDGVEIPIHLLSTKRTNAKKNIFIFQFNTPDT